MLKHVTFFAILAAALLPAAPGLAATCTISGTLKYEPTDMYYCDSDWQNCADWIAVDYDRKRGATAVPMQHMLVEIRQTVNGAPLKTVYTSSTGAYSASVTLPACTGNVFVTPRMWRRHETDTTRYRFRLIDALNRDVAVSITAPLTGAATSFSHTLPASSTSLAAHYYAVYYSMNVAENEIVNWNATVNAGLSGTTVANIQPVIVDPTYTGPTNCESAAGQIGKISLAYSRYRSGFAIRHELGHWVHALMHRRTQRHTCLDYRYPDLAGLQEHFEDGCEFGYAATMEGIANFLAARSATTHDTNVWGCYLTTGAQDTCSGDVPARVGDIDGDGMSAGRWTVYGDSVANARTKCVNLTTSGRCACGGAGQPLCTDQAFRESNGFRNEVQVARFLWDLVDTNNESGLDDTDLSVGSFITAMLGMPCDAGSGDGNCNEPDPAVCTAAKREKYNPRDLDDLIAGDQSQERTLNCVASAPD